MAKLTKKDILNLMIEEGYKLQNKSTVYHYHSGDKQFYWTESSSSMYVEEKEMENIIDTLLNSKDKWINIFLMDKHGNKVIHNLWGIVTNYDDETIVSNPFTWL